MGIGTMVFLFTPVWMICYWRPLCMHYALFSHIVFTTNLFSDLRWLLKHLKAILCPTQRIPFISSVLDSVEESFSTRGQISQNELVSVKNSTEPHVVKNLFGSHGLYVNLYLCDSVCISKNESYAVLDVSFLHTRLGQPLYVDHHATEYYSLPRMVVSQRECAQRCTVQSPKSIPRDIFRCIKPGFGVGWLMWIIYDSSRSHQERALHISVLEVTALHLALRLFLSFTELWQTMHCWGITPASKRLLTPLSCVQRL